MESDNLTPVSGLGEAGRRATARSLHVFAAALLGAVIIYGVGLSPVAAIHNAAHDGRHVLAFPCH